MTERAIYTVAQAADATHTFRVVSDQPPIYAYGWGGWEIDHDKGWVSVQCPGNEHQDADPNLGMVVAFADEECVTPFACECGEMVEVAA